MTHDTTHGLLCFTLQGRTRQKYINIQIPRCRMLCKSNTGVCYLCAYVYCNFEFLHGNVLTIDTIDCLYASAVVVLLADILHILRGCLLWCNLSLALVFKLNIVPTTDVMVVVLLKMNQASDELLDSFYSQNLIRLILNYVCRFHLISCYKLTSSTIYK